MSSGLMVFYPKTHQIPWGYLNSFLSVPRKEARAEAGILLTTRSSSLKKKRRIWYVVLELHFVTRLGLTSTLIVCTGPWHLKGRKRCHCYVLYCSLHSACNTVHKKCLRWENKKIRKKIVKKCEDFISTHILQEKENGKTISLTVRTHCYCQPNQWFSSKSKSLEFLSKFIQIHLISMHTIQTWRKRAEKKNYDVWKVHHQQQSLSQQWQYESLLQTWHFSPG